MAVTAGDFACKMMNSTLATTQTTIPVGQGLTAKDVAVTAGDFACKMMNSTLAITQTINLEGK